MEQYQGLGELEVLFGSSPLICRDYKITSKVNNVPVATLRFKKGNFVALGAINYLDDVTIDSVRPKRRVFTGNIVSITSEPNDQVSVSLVSGVELNETGVRGLTLLQVDPREVAYSLARQAGFPHDHIDIPGLDYSVKDMLAIVPFKGLVIEQEEKVGEVEFLNLKGLQERLPKIERNETWNGFLDADGWIALRFAAAHFSDAEVTAIEKADVFFSAYSGVLQYGYSQFVGTFVEWERTRETINLKRQSYILLVMLHSRGTWLRDLAPYKPTQTTLKPTVSLDMKAIMGASENFQLPLLLWNRFRDSEDYYVVAIGLSQVFEFLSSGVKLPKKNTKAQLKDLAVRTGANLTEQERELVQQAINKLNERTLSEKFQRHLHNIGLALSQDEQDLVQKFRDIRNALEHGRKPQEPSQPEIKRVKALVNRIVLMSLTASERTSDN